MQHIKCVKARTGVAQYYSQLLSTIALVALVNEVDIIWFSPKVPLLFARLQSKFNFLGRF